MAAILLADAPGISTARISWRVIAGTASASCPFFLAGLAPFPLLAGFVLLLELEVCFVLLVLAALGAASAGRSDLVFERV